MECPRCEQETNPRRLFCEHCGQRLHYEGSVLTSTDESRGRALDEMYRGVQKGRADFQRQMESQFEQTVYEHYRGSI